MEFLAVSADSTPTTVAGEIAGCIRSYGRLQIETVSADELDVAVKAIAIARGYMEPVGLDLICVPTLVEKAVGGRRQTVVRLIVKPHGT